MNVFSLRRAATADRPPIDLTCTPEAMAALQAHLGVATGNAVLDRLDVDLRRVGLPFIGPAERSAVPLGSEGVDFWGCRIRKVETEFNTYYEWDGHPLARLQDGGGCRGARLAQPRLVGLLPLCRG